MGKSAKSPHQPPKTERFKPGFDPKRKHGNRDTAGAITKNYFNGMARRETRVGDLKRIIADDSKPPLMQAAAEQILQSRKRTTLADFDPWIEGRKTLTQLAAAGVDISMVKRARVGDRTTRINEKGVETITEGERSIELFESSGNNLDRIIEQTDGRPKLTAEITQNVIFRTPADRNLAAAQASARLGAILKAHCN